jgi:hypothetical protein
MCTSDDSCFSILVHETLPTGLLSLPCCMNDALCELLQIFTMDVHWTRVAWDCLSHNVTMNTTTGLPAGHTMEEIRHGHVSCGHGCNEGGCTTGSGILLLWLLCLLHGMLCLGPLVCVCYITVTGEPNSQWPQHAVAHISMHDNMNWRHFDRG